MSYARFGWDGSDIYLFLSAGGYLDCCGCILQEREWIDDTAIKLFKGYFKAVGEIIQTKFKTVEECLAHLEKHIQAGHTVPEDVFERLNDPKEQEYIKNYINNHKELDELD